MAGHSTRRGVVKFALIVLMAGSSGCGETADPQIDQKHIRALATFYGRYSAMNRGQLPPDEAALRKFIGTITPGELSGLGIDPANLDSAFISPRDKQKYEIRYAKTVAAAKGKPGQPVIAMYEQAGVNGKRLVAHSTGQVEEVDEAKFKELVPGAK